MVLGSHRVLAERPASREIQDFMLRFPALGHRPDLVLVDLDGPGTYTLIDVKVFDPAGPGWITRHHTDTTRLAAHLWHQRYWPRVYFPTTDGVAPPRLRLITFCISTFGSFGPDALSLLRTLARRCGSSVPPSLIEEASWATPAFAPFARQALALTVRRSLASRLRDGGVSPVEAQARLAEPPRDSPQDPLRVFDAPEPDPAD